MSSGKTWALTFCIWAGPWTLTNMLWGIAKFLMWMSGASPYMVRSLYPWLPMLGAFVFLLCVVKVWHGFRYWMVGAFLLFVPFACLSPQLLHGIANSYLLPPLPGTDGAVLNMGMVSMWAGGCLDRAAVDACGYALAMIVLWLMRRYGAQATEAQVADEASSFRAILDRWFPTLAGLTVTVMLVRILEPVFELIAVAIGFSGDAIQGSSVFTLGIIAVPVTLYMAAAALAASVTAYLGRGWVRPIGLWRVGSLMLLLLLSDILSEAERIMRAIDLAGRHPLVGSEGQMMSVLEHAWIGFAPTLAPGLVVALAFWLSARLSGRRVEA